MSVVSMKCFSVIVERKRMKQPSKLARIYAKNIAHKQVNRNCYFYAIFSRSYTSYFISDWSEKIQQGFEPLMPGFHYLPFNEDTSLKQLKEINPCAVLIEIVPRGRRGHSWQKKSGSRS